MIIVLHDDKHGYTIEEAKLGPYELRAFYEGGFYFFKFTNDTAFVGEVVVTDALPAGSTFGETGVNQIEGKDYEMQWTELPTFDWNRSELDVAADPQANRKITEVNQDVVRKAEERTRQANLASRDMEVERAKEAQQTVANAKAK